MADSRGGNQRRIRLLLDYDGSEFAGWQVQPGEQTVQETLEQALASILSEPVRIHGAGRTDAGVHAQGQTAHFDTHSTLPPAAIAAETNRILPPEIVIRGAGEAGKDFHARYSATGKIYRYLAWTGNQRSAYWRNRTGWFPGPRDLDLMRLGADALVGTHDFSALAAAGRAVDNAVRTIRRLEIRTLEPDLLCLEVEGDGFLYRMVRNIVGTLMEVGRGRLSPEEVSQIRESKDRRRAGPTAPAQGLCLIKVLY